MPPAKRPRPAPEGGGAEGPRLSIRLDLGDGARIGPGKVRLLEEIARAGSISAAGRALGMSYRRAWELVEALNRGGWQAVNVVGGMEAWAAAGLPVVDNAGEPGLVV